MVTSYGRRGGASSYTDSDAVNAVETSDPLSLQNDLGMVTGQAIEDGSGTKRLELLSSQTRIFDQSGNERIEAYDGDRMELTADSTTPLIFRDDEGSFDPVKYTTSASAPGTFYFNGAIAAFHASGSGQGGVSDTAAEVQSGGPNSSRKLVFSGSDGGAAYLRQVAGELEATDNNGNTVTLT